MSVFERYDGKTPDRATCDAIARAFTQSPVRNPRRRRGPGRRSETRRDSLRRRRRPASPPPSAVARADPLPPAPPPLPPPLSGARASPDPFADPSDVANEFERVGDGSTTRARRMVGSASPAAAAAATGSASRSASGGGSGGSSEPTAREREGERERDPTPSGTHPRASLRLPGALDDAIMLDSESPMFPSVMWSDAAADEKTLLRPASLFDKDPAPTTRGDDARSDSDAEADAAADAVAAEEGDLWWDIRAGNGRNDVNGVETPAGEATTREATPGDV